jgi:glycine betaine/proline transport system substrate-binding protein
MTKKRQDFVILAWEPHINNALFDLAFLAQDNLNPESPPLFPTDSLFAVTRKNYPETCPQVTRLIHQLQVSRPLIHFLMAQHLIHKKPLHDTFIQWLHEHKRFLATSLTGIKTLDGKNAFLAALQTLLLSRKTSPEPE